MRTGIRAGRSAFFTCLIRVPSVARLSPYRRDSPLQFLSTPWLKKVRSGIAGQTRGRPYGDRRVAAGRAAAEVPKLELGNQKKLELGNQKSAWEPEIREGTRYPLGNQKSAWEPEVRCGRQKRDSAARTGTSFRPLPGESGSEASILPPGNQTRARA